MKRVRDCKAVVGGDVCDPNDQWNGSWWTLKCEIVLGGGNVLDQENCS